MEWYVFNETSKNCIASPACAKQGMRLVASKKHTGLLPIICQPPGLWDGYTPVCLPPIATAPGSIFNRGVGFLGKAKPSSKPPKYKKPGKNPMK
jgi:hypothetical protein